MKSEPHGVVSIHFVGSRCDCVYVYLVVLPVSSLPSDLVVLLGGLAWWSCLVALLGGVVWWSCLSLIS